MFRYDINVDGADTVTLVDPARGGGNDFSLAYVTNLSFSPVWINLVERNARCCKRCSEYHFNSIGFKNLKTTELDGMDECFTIIIWTIVVFSIYFI